MKILFTFAGQHDKGRNEDGPIMTAHAALCPDLTIIFTTNSKKNDDYYKNALNTMQALDGTGYRRKYNFGGKIEIQNLSIDRPNNHYDILTKIRSFCTVGNE